MFASFPAAFSATAILLVRAHGIDFTAATSRAMVNGNLTNVVFVIGSALLVPPLGVGLGMVLAYLICAGFALFSYRYIMTRL